MEEIVYFYRKYNYDTWFQRIKYNGKFVIVLGIKGGKYVSMVILKN